MAFMQTVIQKNPAAFVVHEGQDEFGPQELVETRLPNTLPAGEYSEDTTFGEAIEKGLDGDDITDILTFLKEEKIESFEVTEPLYHGELSAPGYMDRTGWTIGKTYAEVAEQLIDLYFSGEIAYMDEQERQELKWLERVAAGEDPEEALSADEADK